MRNLSRLATLSLLALTWAVPASAQAPVTPPPSTTYLLARLTAGTTLERYLQLARASFGQLDVNSDGRLTGADDEIRATMMAAQYRASAISQLIRADLNNDGAVTADELRALMRYEQRASQLGVTEAAYAERIDRVVADMMKPDADGDGRVTLAEAAAAFQSAPTFRVPGYRAPPTELQTLLAFDVDGDGALTLPELEAAYDVLFRTVDADGNGTVSAEELAAYRARLDEPNAALRREAAAAAERRQAERQRFNAERAQRAEAEAAERKRKEDEAHAKCAMPKASNAAKIVMLGLYETEALSSVALGSMDKVTHAGTITVEPGAEPLYLVITSYAAAIWHFSGAVDRIERVVLASLQATGATGLPAERLTQLAGSNCLPYFTELQSGETAKASGRVAEDAGRAPDLVVARYEVGGFSVPSGAVQRQTDPRKPQVMVIQKSGGSITIEGDASNIVVQTPSMRSVEAELRRFSPGGVMEVDASKVVSLLPAMPYDVLPQQAGLLQLMRSGALTRNQSGEFLIQRKIRYPAGLAGAHSVRFLLLKGVPQPDGDPAHSRVISEETGQPIGKP
ncbi:MAG: EF-hand domain-containing protein [Rhodopseudomonas palustris]|uniref:EF-hand domain-containing protein n=1 Tax=Rhodopseudomonas palustris TaxID=1076 RepID=A0A933S0C9_RHOPL|nr:EF-hand domain-containing protein [Rhodopseudomonas palustris]